MILKNKMKYIFYCYLYESSQQHRIEIENADSLEEAKEKLNSMIEEDFDIILEETETI